MKTLFLILMTQLLLASNLALAEDSVTATQALTTMDIQAMSHNGKLEMTPIARNENDLKLDKKFQVAIEDGLHYLSTYGQSNAVITGSFDPVLKYFDDKYRRSDFKIFSAHSSEAALLYAMKGATEHEKVLVISKTWAEANYAKGFALFELGQLGEAKYYLTKALALSPFNATYLFELGQILLREKNWQQALIVFKSGKQWLSLTEPSVKTMLQAGLDRSIGITLIETGQLDEAEAIYRQLLTENDNDEKSRNELAYIQKLRNERNN